LLAELCLVGFFAYSWPPAFWVLPTLSLSPSAAAVAVGFINICANIAGALGNPIVGFMREHHVSESACLLFLAGCFILGGVIITLIRLPRAAAPNTAFE
jgi:ACS family tartrate transporter-like MFS transporter